MYIIYLLHTTLVLQKVPILVRYMAKVVLRKVYFMEMEGSAVRSSWCSSIEH